MVKVGVILENGQDLGSALVAKRRQRCTTSHGAGVRKVERCLSKELVHNARDRGLPGSCEICRDHAQEYLLWWTEKRLCRAIEHKIKLLLL